MSNGVLCFANNNGKVDYLKQAIFLAERVKKYLGVPISLATANKRDFDYMYFDKSDLFDKIIEIDQNDYNTKRYYDGTYHHVTLDFKNSGRINSFDLSPYDNTLVLDTDYIICNGSFTEAFKSAANFQIYRKGTDLCDWRNLPEFDYINDIGIPFYWATCFCFKKNNEVKIFFNLMKHIKKHWFHYSQIFNLGTRNFRNDHIFSIAIHIMNGYQEGDWAKTLPGKMFYTLDRDLICKLEEDKLLFLVEKQNRSGEYTLASTKGSNVHVMNKFSLARMI
jgi:hypothetical protein|tara:strand:- start:377 stop:1210 length:834 start_codon:yes stop_codon:yes gene_type:complete